MLSIEYIQLFISISVVTFPKIKFLLKFFLLNSKNVYKILCCIIKDLRRVYPQS